MPLYEYRCQACGYTFERLETVSAAPTRSCLLCEKRAVRQLGVPALQFKGSGWYVTDYSRGNTVPAAALSGDRDARVGAA